MGYMHINNLYKEQDILLFRECYAMEKIHGTSSHISHKNGKVGFFIGGGSHERFISLFDQDKLLEKLQNMDVIIYGEAYGGKIQKMSATYGKEMKFVAFDVKIDGMWLSVPQAEEFCKNLDIEFVHYVRIPTDLDSLNEQRDADSIQAIRNGMGTGHKREGIVLRPLIELTKNNSARIICKYKGDDFKETKTPRTVSPEQLKILEDAKSIAEEWVTPMRIIHVMDKIQEPCMEKMKEIMIAMQEDIEREGEGEIIWSKEVCSAIGRATAQGVKQFFMDQLYNGEK